MTTGILRNSFGILRAGKGMAIAAAALSLWSAAPSSAAALLDGADITASYRYPELGTAYVGASFTPSSFTVGAAQESTLNLENVVLFAIDFSDTALAITLDLVPPYPGGTLTSPSGTSFDGLVFTSSAFEQVAGISLGSVAWAGFDLGRVAIVGDQLRIDLRNISLSDDANVRLEFSAVSAVPESSTWALLILGFGAIGFRMRAARRADGQCSTAI